MAKEMGFSASLAEKVECGECGVDCTRHYMMCDHRMDDLCPKCFAGTPCGKGEHGEGCATSVFSDSK